ncbi:MAG: hypothetical protein K5662_09270 [Lachnospiraceae bacterium]|nr:hypothetical protein [Lachnospiraceae bacterium]
MIRKWLISVFFFTILLAVGCGMQISHNQKPDDDLSCSVHEIVGNAFYYNGKEEKELSGTCYDYQIVDKNAEAISLFIRTVQTCMENANKKISVYAYTEIPGGYASVFGLRNYLIDGEGDGDCTSEYVLFISSFTDLREDVYYDPLTYTGIEGITVLSVPLQMDQRAKENALDWYESSPDLKRVIVRDK